MKKITNEDPLIRINWKKAGIYIKNIAIFLVKITVAIVSLIIKIVLRVLIIALRILYWMYKRLSNFCKRNIKGLWLVLLFVIFCLFGFWFVKQRSEIKELKLFQKSQQNVILNIFEENEKLREEIETLNKKPVVQPKTVRSSTPLLPEIKQLVTKYTSIYGIAKDTQLVECIIFNESGGDPNAVGDNGTSIGVCQYKLSTFLSHRKQMGLSEEDLRRDPDASIQAMAWSISRGGIGNWTTRYKCI